MYAPYSPATRLLATLDLLQSRPSITAEQLAERLEVEPRSVRRYIMMLQQMGIPIEAERGRYGGYHLRPGFKLPPLMFSTMKLCLNCVDSDWATTRAVSSVGPPAG